MAVIKRVELQKLSPIVWYSILIYKKSNQIKGLLEELGGDEVSQFLLEPKEAGGDISWSFSRDLKPFDSLSSSKKEAVLQKVKAKSRKIIELAETLKSSEDDRKKELGELLSLAIEFPDFSFIYVDKNLEPFIAGWGFKWRDGRSTSGRILQRIDQKEREINSTTQAETPNSSETKVEYSSVEKKKGINWLLISLLLLLLILLATIWYLLTNRDQPSPTPPPQRDSSGISHTTPQPPKVKFKPISQDKIKPDPNLPAKPKLVTDRLVVVLKDGANIDNFKKGLEKIGGVEIIYESDILKSFELEISSEDKIEKIKTLPEILSIKKERVIKKNSTLNDPLFSNPDSSWQFRAVDSFGAWEITKGSPKTVIAVVDGSFDLTHPELRNKTIIMPYNASLGVSKILNSDVESASHGTHVASLAVGEMGNSKGSAGLCPECSLMPIELALKGVKGFSSMAKIRGVLYAIEHGADVINLSLGISYGEDFASLPFEEKQKLREKIKAEIASEKVIYDRLYEYAKSKNVIIVYASGNEDMFVDIDPAKEDNSSVILVSAVDKNAKKASFSNFGANIDISAPGVKIVSATPNSNYQAMSGTSMASPIVAGVVGLMKSIYPEITLKQVKEILKKSAKPVTSPSNEPIGGLIDAKRALVLTKKLKRCRDNNSSTPPKPKFKKGQKMKMPTSNRGVEFSYGLWKSNTPLKNLSNEDVTVYYYLSKDGSYREIKEATDSCKGGANPRLEGRVLYIKCASAICQKKPQVSYSPTIVECKPDENNIVICKSKGSTASAKFELIKVR